MSEFGLYTKEQSDALWAWYEQNQGREDAPFLENTFDTPEWYFVKLKQDLDVATSPLTGYTEALAEVVKLSYTSDNKDREVVTDTDFNITITNRSTLISAEEGDFLWVREIGPEYVPFIMGGESTGASIMHYTIDGCDEDYYYVTATYWTGGCGDPPGKDEYTELWTVEKLPCSSPWTVDDIEAGDVHGIATYTYPVGGAYCLPVWREVSSCGPMTC